MYIIPKRSASTNDSQRGGCMTNNNDEFDIYSIGICSASVCTSLSLEEATDRLNERHPTGLETRWQLTESKTFSKGEPHPCPCENNPTTHTHYLFHCKHG